MADENVLGELDGYPVSTMAIAIRGAGDGLSDELDIAPNPHETGSETYFVLRCVTGPIDHEPLDSEGKKPKGRELVDGFSSYKRVEDHICLDATEVSADDVKAFIEASNTRIMQARHEREVEAKRLAEEERKRAEEEAGIMAIPGIEPGEVTDEEWEASPDGSQ